MASMTYRTAPRRRSRVPLIAGILVIVLVAGLVVAEFYARNRVENCLQAQFESELGSQIDVGLGLQPVLLSLATNNFSSVDIESADTSFGPAQDLQVQATINDVDLDATETSGGTIGSSSADLTWSTEGILATLQSQGIGGVVSTVTSDPAAGTLNFDIVGGLAQLSVQPLVQGDTVAVETVNASILGLGLPTDLVDSVVSILTDSLQAYPLGMTPQSLEVTDTGIEMSLAGGEYVIPAAQPGQADAQQPISC